MAKNKTIHQFEDLGRAAEFQLTERGELFGVSMHDITLTILDESVVREPIARIYQSGGRIAMELYFTNTMINFTGEYNTPEGVFAHFIGKVRPRADEIADERFAGLKFYEC